MEGAGVGFGRGGRPRPRVPCRGGTVKRLFSSNESPVTWEPIATGISEADGRRVGESMDCVDPAWAVLLLRLAATRLAKPMAAA